ncbi:unnamed protein product [Trichobilharzia szidati]|nr:unnamed protein product [Trichobilharzia szidati]
MQIPLQHVLCIKFQSINLSDQSFFKKSDLLTKSSLMQIFLFKKNLYILKNAQFTIAVSSFYTSPDEVCALRDQQHEQQNQWLDELIDLKLFVDAFHCQSSQSLRNYNTNGHVNLNLSFLKADEGEWPKLNSSIMSLGYYFIIRLPVLQWIMPMMSRALAAVERRPLKWKWLSGKANR